MEGIFTRKKFFGPLGFMSICSIFLIGLYFFLPVIDPEGTKGSLSFLLMGVLLALVTIPSWTLNRGAFFHVTEDAIRAKFHWFGKIDCKLSDVTFVFPQINTLTIFLKITNTIPSWESLIRGRSLPSFLIGFRLKQKNSRKN